MKSKPAVLTALTLALCATAYAAPQHQLTGPGFKNIAYFTQDLRLSGDLTTSLNVAPLTSSKAGFGLTKLGTPFPGGAIGSMAPVLLTQPVNQGDALAKAVVDIPANFLAFKPAVNAWLTKEGVTTAIIDYTQDVLVNTVTGPKTKSIVFNARLDVDGRATYGLPKLIDPSPTVTEVMYTPLTSLQGLPADWAYPDAGTIKWRVTTDRYVPLTGWTTVNVLGAYDETRAVDKTNPDVMVTCLMDSTGPGCPNTLDVRKLMNQNGSSVSLVSYVRSLEPVYTENPDGSMTTSFAVSVDSRTFDCVNYTNAGQFGMALARRVDQYLATLGGKGISHTLTQRASSQVTSPTSTYALSAVLGGTDPETVLLSPVPGESTWLQSDAEKMRSVTYIAPMTLLGTCIKVPGGYELEQINQSGGNDGGNGPSDGGGESCGPSGDSSSSSDSCSASSF